MIHSWIYVCIVYSIYLTIIISPSVPNKKWTWMNNSEWHSWFHRNTHFWKTHPPLFKKNRKHIKITQTVLTRKCCNIGSDVQGNGSPIIKQISKLSPHSMGFRDALVAWGTCFFKMDWNHHPVVLLPCIFLNNLTRYVNSSQCNGCNKNWPTNWGHHDAG